MTTIQVQEPGPQNHANTESLVAARKGLIEELISAGVSGPGVDWVVSAIDPWHSEDMAKVGLPTNDAGKSVVQTINQTVTINAPPNLNALNGDTWDCHIATMPLLASAGYYQGGPDDIPFTVNSCFGVPGSDRTIAGLYSGFTTDYKPNASADPITGTPVPGNPDGWIQDALLVAHSVPSGAATFTPGFNVQGAADSEYVQPAIADQRYDSVSVPQLTQWDQSRVIALSYKVTNISPPLQQGGYVTDYKHDVVALGSSRLKYNAGTTRGAVGTYDTVEPVNVCVAPPYTSEKVILMEHTSRQASYGSLVTVPIDVTSVEQVARFPETCNAVYHSQIGMNSYDDLSVDPNGFVLAVDSWSTDIYANLGATDETVGAFSRCVNIRPHGSYYTGLPAQTALRLEVRILVETFPTADDFRMGYATPSPPPDPIAIEMYNKLIREMPAGSYGGSFDNDFGDFMSNLFDTARDVVADVVQPTADVLSSMPGPVGEAARDIAAVSKPALALADAVRPRRRRKRRRARGTRSQPLPKPQNARRDARRDGQRRTQKLMKRDRRAGV